MDMRTKIVSQNDKECLLQSLEALRNLVFYLNKDALYHSDEVLIRLWHQILGNCLKKLSLTFITNSQELKNAIFWEGVNKERIHFYNRMDTAHERRFSNFIKPIDTSFKKILLQECQTLISIIEGELSEASAVNAPAIIDGFNLMIGTPLQLGQGNSSEDCICNIWQALEICNTININNYTLSNIATILMITQVIGNNLKKLPAEYINKLDSLLLEKIINNRNTIAHVTELASLMEQPSYFCDQYFTPLGALREGIRHLAEPIIKAAVAVASVAAEPNSAADDSKEDEQKSHTYYEAHSKLFKRLQKDGIINRAIKLPKQQENDRIFSDEDLLHILALLILEDNITLYTEILSNLKHYTDTETRLFINTPMPYRRDPKVCAPRPDPNTICLQYLSDRYKYIPPIALDHACDSAMFAAREEAYPIKHDMHLLALSFSLKENPNELRKWGTVNEFTMLLLKLDVDIDTVMHISSSGQQPLLFSVVCNAHIDSLSLLVHYGANPNICHETGETILSAAIVSNWEISERIALVKKLLNCGANPCKIVDIKNDYRGHLLCKLMGTWLTDDKASRLAKILINDMVYKRGFNAIKIMLESTISLEGVKPIEQSFVNLINQCREEDKKIMFPELFDVLEGLNKSKKDCKLFKVVLSNNLPNILKFLEEQNRKNRHKFLHATFEYSKIKDSVGVGFRKNLDARQKRQLARDFKKQGMIFSPEHQFTKFPKASIVAFSTEKMTLLSFAQMFCTKDVTSALEEIIRGGARQISASISVQASQDDSKQDEAALPSSSANLALQVLAPDAQIQMPIIPPESGEPSNLSPLSASALRNVALPGSTVVQQNAASVLHNVALPKKSRVVQQDNAPANIGMP